MIELYVHAAKIGEYQTRGIGEGQVFSHEARNTEYQPPGSFEVVIEGDGVDLAVPFPLAFGITKETIPDATFALVELRLKLYAATSIKHTELNMWRALQGGKHNLKYMDPTPLGMNKQGLTVWYFNSILRPKFGMWTSRQAETIEDYLLYRDEYPFQPNNVPFDDFTLFSDGTGWSN